jgi:hypothetical protein
MTLSVLMKAAAASTAGDTNHDSATAIKAVGTPIVAAWPRGSGQILSVF